MITYLLILCKYYLTQLGVREARSPRSASLPKVGSFTEYDYKVLYQPSSIYLCIFLLFDKAHHLLLFSSNHRLSRHGGPILLLPHYLLSEASLVPSLHPMKIFSHIRSGKLVQIGTVSSDLAATASFTNSSLEYALNAVNQGVTSLGIKGTFQ